jgi:hypothetical protein
MNQLERSRPPAALFFLRRATKLIGGKDCDVRFCWGRRNFPSQVFRRSLNPAQCFMRAAKLMTEPRFKIGQSLFYRAGRVRLGKFVVLAVTAQPAGKIRYRIRSQDDETIEYIADESELSIS